MTISALAAYLDQPVSQMLADMPFRDWQVEKSFEDDLEEPCTDYIFPENGMDLTCDRHAKVATIFLYADGSRCFKEGLDDLPFTSERQDVLDYFGTPSKSGGATFDPILGDLGSWDRFARENYVVHIRYGLDSGAIDMVTLMRPDVAP